MNDRSPHLFPHIVVRNMHPRAPEVSPAPHSSELELMRRWVEFDSEFDEHAFGHPLNSWTILGIVIVIVTSGAFWTGVGLLINYWLK